MRRIGLAVIFGICVLAPLVAEGSQAGKVYRLGYLNEGSVNSEQPESRGIGISGLRRGLRNLGWTEGENLVIEARFAEGKLDRLAGLVADLMRLNVDAIVVVGT